MDVESTIYVIRTREYFKHRFYHKLDILRFPGYKVNKVSHLAVNDIIRALTYKVRTNIYIVGLNNKGAQLHNTQTEGTLRILNSRINLIDAAYFRETSFVVVFYRSNEQQIFSDTSSTSVFTFSTASATDQNISKVSTIQDSGRFFGSS